MKANCYGKIAGFVKMAIWNGCGGIGFKELLGCQNGRATELSIAVWQQYILDNFATVEFLGMYEKFHSFHPAHDFLQVAIDSSYT